MTTPIIIENIGKDIIYWTRKSNGELVKVIDKKFYPYFYVEDPQGEFVSIYGERAKKIIVNHPKRVKSLREKFEKEGKKTFEADIKYTVRYSIDKFEIPWEKVPLRIWYFDIEVMDSLDYINTPKPIISITIYDNFDKKYYSLGWGKTTKKYVYKEGEIYIFDNEVKMLNYFIKLLDEKDPDLLVAWNIQYDINYLVNRMRKLNINYNKISRLGTVVLNEKNEVVKVYGRALVDLANLYVEMKKKTPESLSLETIANYENLPVKKLPKPKFVPENIINVLAYNKIDVQVIVELDNKLGIINFWDELRRFVGLPWNNFCVYVGKRKPGARTVSPYTIVNNIIVDTYLLRKAKKKGIVLPTAKHHEKISYGGAIPILPPIGVFKNVVVLDVKSMYPNIIRTYNLSPETLDENGEILVPTKKYLLDFLTKLKSFNKIQIEDIKTKIIGKIIYEGQKFKKEPIGLIPEACSELFELRKQYKKKMKEYLEKGDDEKAKEYDAKQSAIKEILNSLYGVMGYRNFRLFKPEVAEAVTTFGKALLLWITYVVEKEGYKILYGDTDSVFVKFPDNWNKEQCLEEAQRLIEIINNSFNEFAKKWNVDKHYHEIELKFIFDRIAFFGKKKKYAGYYVNEEGVWKEGFEVKGLQIIRSDSNMITKIVFQRVLDMLLKEGKPIEEIKTYINKVKEQIYMNKIPIQYLVWKVSYDPNKQYKNKNIPHLRGLRFAKELGLIDNPMGKIVWIYIKNSVCDTIAVPEDKIELLRNFKVDGFRVAERSFGNIEKLLDTLRSSGKNIIFSYLKNHDEK